MGSVLKRLRGMIGIGVLWAAIWTPLGLGLATMQYLRSGLGLPPSDFVLAVLVSGLANGFATGFLFSGGLSLVYRRKTFDEIGVPAMGAVGALVGMILPAVTLLPWVVSQSVMVKTSSVVVAIGFSAGLGATTAVGLLKVAQAAPQDLTVDSPDCASGTLRSARVSDDEDG